MSKRRTSQRSPLADDSNKQSFQEGSVLVKDTASSNTLGENNSQELPQGSVPHRDFPREDAPSYVTARSQDQGIDESVQQQRTRHHETSTSVTTSQIDETTADAVGNHLHDVSRQFAALSAQVAQLQTEQSVLIDAVRQQRDRVYDGDGDEEAADAALYAALERVTGEDERPSSSRAQ